MTKKIMKLVQKNDGGQNPKTELFEQPIWLLTLEDGEEKVLRGGGWHGMCEGRGRRE
jgi:hypothetical protein